MRAPHFAASIFSITVRQRARVKSVKSIRNSALVWGGLALAGCASSIVGLQSDGTYILERNERSYSCDALRKDFTDRVEVMKLLPEKAKAERQEAPQTAASMISRWMSGPNKGLVAIEHYDRERAHAQALQRTMAEKNCPPVDLDRELAEADTEVTRIRGN